MLYPCLCCGYLTLTEKPPGTYLICPICCWEDSLTDDEPGSNDVSLRSAQRNFMTFGACEREWLSYVRSPSSTDQRDPHWQTIDAQADAASLLLIEQITKAFDGVSRDNGVSLHEARAIDDYEGESGRAAARQKDTESRWQDVPVQWLEEFSDVFHFFDAKGFRYYLPAYMIWAIKNYQITKSNSLDMMIYSLDVYEDKDFPDYDPYHRFRLFNQEQVKAVAAFLRFMVNYGRDWVDARAADRALRKYWDIPDHSENRGLDNRF